MAKLLCTLVAVLGWLASAHGVIRAPGIVISSRSLVSESLGNDGVLQSNEVVTCSITLKNVGIRHGTNISAILIPAEGLTPIVSEQHYGELDTNGVSVAREFTFQLTGARPGSVVQGTLVIRSNGQELSRNVFDLPVGDNVSAFDRLDTLVIAGNTNGIGPASVYPSIIGVSNLVGVISNIRVTLHNYQHTFAEDVNVLLVAPNGAQIMLMSDCGGFYEVNNVNLTFSSAVTNSVPTLGNIFSGTYSASDFNSPNIMAPPAPVNPPFGTSLAVLKNKNPNGDWALYVDDNRLVDEGIIGGGWSLTFTLLRPPTLSITDNGDGRVRLVLAGTGARSFLIDYSTNAVHWNVLGQTSATADPAILFDNRTPQNRFYRARRINP